MGDPNSNDAGFVTQFDIPWDYFSKFKVETVGLEHHQELWVPAEQLDEFNAMIVDGIKVTRAFIGKQFVVPDEMKQII